MWWTGPVPFRRIGGSARIAGIRPKLRLFLLLTGLARDNG
jgi:hypothetical protein